MNKLASLLSFCLFWWCLAQPASAERIKIACTGFDQTIGTGIINPAKNSYPAQLQVYLGNDYEVRNFGHDAKGLPTDYLQTSAYSFALSWIPDIVIHLSEAPHTQDSIYSPGLYREYEQLIDGYRQLSTPPRIILLSPLRSYRSGNKGTHDTATRQGIRSLLEEVAYHREAEFVDLYPLFPEKQSLYLLPDSLHPSAGGAGEIAQYLYEYLSTNREEFRIHPGRHDHPENHAGFRALQSNRKRADFRIITPARCAKGRPWIIRREINERVDRILLERGFHIVYLPTENIADQSATIRKQLLAYGLPATGGKEIDATADYRDILRENGLYQNRCEHPVCGTEYRAWSVGWTAGAEWHSVSDEISRKLRNRPMKVLLLGNSITQGFGGSRDLVTLKPGKQALDSIVGPGNWESAGITSDKTQHLLWRLLYGGYEEARPENIFITIGVNNLGGEADTPAEIAAGITRITRLCESLFPESNIVLFGLLPAGATPDHRFRTAGNEVHRLLEKEIFDHASYVNPTEWFIHTDGSLHKELYSRDELHLSAAGYAAWAGHIGRLLRKNTP